MTLPPQARWAVGLLLVSVAVIEIGVVVWVLVLGPFALHLGPVPFSARYTTKPFLVGMLTGSIGIWLLKPFDTSQAQSWLGAVCRSAACAAVILSIVPLVAPIFLPDFLVGHDGAVHQTYAFLMDRALQQGQLPVRWVEGIADGLGQPLFNYYQVGFYYLVALIHRCGPSLSLALKLTVAAAWVSGAAFMFLLCKPLGLFPGALAAAVFAWSPYLLLDVYVRTAYPELTAVALAPGVLWSINRVLRTGRPIFVCTLALTTGLLLISHLPTGMIVAPVAAAYVVGSVMVHRHAARVMGLVAVGAAMGTGLAAFYVVPAIAEREAIRISRLTSAYFDYHHHFVRPEWWVDWSWAYGSSGVGAADQLSLQIGIVQWIVLAAAVILLGVPQARQRAATQVVPVAGWLTVVGVALFMMTAPSVSIWEGIGPLAFIQFPWRFLMLPTLACSVLAATLLSAIRPRTVQALLVLCAVAVQWYVTREYTSMARTRERAEISIDDPAWPSTDNARRWAFREPGYDPVSVTHEDPWRPAPGRWTVAEGRGDVSAISETDALLGFVVRAQEPVKLVINSPFLPGWRVSLDGRPISPSIRSDSGYMEVRVPVGSHRVEAVFGKSRVRAAAEGVTLISVITWVSLVCWTAYRRGSRCCRRLDHHSDRHRW